MALSQLVGGADEAQGSHDLGNNHNPRAHAPFDLSDDLLDKYLEEPEDTGKKSARAPAAKSAPLEDDGEDTPSSMEEDSDLDDLLNTGDEDEGEGDETDEDEEIDALLKDEDEDEGEAEKEEDTFLSTFNRDKFLKKYKDNPDVMAAYKSFNADYTKAKQALKAQETEWQGKLDQANQLQEQYDSFASKLSDDKGMQDFLLQIALHRPEVFDTAYEQALSLNEDEGQKTAYLKEQQIKEREAKLEREEKARAQQTQAQKVQRIETLTHKAAEKLGLSGVEIEIAEQYVANAIYEARARGKGLPEDADVVAAVKAAAKRLGVDKERVQKEAAAKARREAQANLRKKAKDSKRPQPPRGGKSPSAPRAESPKRGNLNEDPMDSLVDSFFNS